MDGQVDTAQGSPTPWEPALAKAMADRCVAVHEEQVVERLLQHWSSDDLRT